MILDIQNIRGFVNLPIFKLPWNKQFMHHILIYNKQYIQQLRVQSNYQNVNIVHKNIVQLMDRHSQIYKNANSSIIVPCVNLKKQVHSYYSNFVPIRNAQYIDKNQYQIQFPYLTYIVQNNYKNRQEQFENDIKENLNNVIDFRKNICEKYNIPINFTASINLYKDVLSFGTKVLKNFKNPYSLLFLLSKCQSYLSKKTNVEVKKNISITIQKSQNINIETITYTMKSLYCPLCFIYDCPVHDDHRLIFGTEIGTQFVSSKNKKQRSKHLNFAMNMLNVVKDQTNLNICCSDYCYLKFQELEKDTKFKLYLINKQSIMSDLTKSLIQLGVHLFSYSPCLIKSLFTKDQIMCCQIYKYFLTELNSEKRIFNKMFQTQQQMLLNEQKSQKVTIPKYIMQQKRKKQTKTSKKYYQQKTNKLKQTTSIAICTHHFINQPSFDENCQNCICRHRGYCTPACLCSQNCKIMMIGCKCCKKNKNSICITNTCPCYANSIECIPQICGKNCWQGDNCCMNRQIQMKKNKKVKIGVSKIPQAGLGLFVIQPVLKDELVALYLGQKIDQLTLQLRDLLRKNNSFYNFQQEGNHIDSRFLGNKSRFINHSNPKQINLKVRIVKSLNQNWIAFYATKNIQPHQQLYFDYDGDGQISKHHGQKYPFIMSK